MKLLGGHIFFELLIGLTLVKTIENFCQAEQYHIFLSKLISPWQETILIWLYFLALILRLVHSAHQCVVIQANQTFKALTSKFNKFNNFLDFFSLIIIFLASFLLALDITSINLQTFYIYLVMFIFYFFWDLMMFKLIKRCNIAQGNNHFVAAVHTWLMLDFFVIFMSIVISFGLHYLISANALDNYVSASYLAAFMFPGVIILSIISNYIINLELFFHK